MTEAIAAEDLAVLDPDILETVLYERSLVDFVKAAWPVLEPMTPLQWNWHHDAICEHLEAVTTGAIRDLVVTIPPGFSKSSLLSILWPAWEWAAMPWTRWLTTSYGADLAVGFAVKTRHLITSEWYQTRWQRAFTLTGDQNVKCLAVGTMIQMADGSLRPVEALTVGDLVQSAIGGSVTIDRVVAHMNTGHQPVRRLTLSDGSMLRITARHRLYGWDAWMLAGDIKVGDSVSVMRRAPAQYGELSRDDAFLLAFWLAEGTKRTCSFEVTTASPSMISRLRGIADARQWRVHQQRRYRYTVSAGRRRYGDTPVNMLRAHGAWHTPADSIRVPSAVFLANDDVVAEFVGTYIACDGTVSAGPNYGVDITSVSEGLIRDLFFLVKRCGVRGDVRSSMGWYTHGGERRVTRRQWRLHIGSADSVLRLSGLHIYGKEAAFTRLLERKRRPARHRDGRTASIPPPWRTGLTAQAQGRVDVGRRGWASRAIASAAALADGNLALAAKLDSDLDWREIVKIDDEPSIQTYDIETAEHHCFFANGVLSHNSFYQNSASGFRVALGVGGAATGRKVDRVVCDDPHKIQRAGPKRVITHDFEGVEWWWTREASTRRNDPMKSARVVIMQRIHARDLAGRLLDHGGYEQLCLPAEFDAGRRARTSVIVNGKAWEDPRTEPGELLWPERFPMVFLEQEKRIQGSDYSALYQQKPSASGGTVFKRIWWRYWVPPGVERRPISVPTAEGFELVEPEELPTVEVEVDERAQAVPETIFEKYSAQEGPRKTRREVVWDEQIQSWDMAFKGTESADFVAGQVWGRIGANAYLLDRRRRHLTFTETLAEVLGLSAAWPLAALKLVEDAANGPAVIDSLQKKLGGLVAVKPQGGKEARAHAVTPLLESHNVYVPAPYVHPWVLEFLAEMDSFPRGENDDDVDACSQALLRFLRSSSEWITIL